MLNSRKIKVHSIVEETYVEGIGKRMAIWFQGCSIQCPGCFNRQTWNPENGYYIDLEEIRILLLKNSSLDGVTILGGEPLIK